MILGYTNLEEKIEKKNIFFIIIICIIGAPIFALNQVLTMLLSLFIPEGWDDDDKFGYLNCHCSIWNGRKLRIKKNSQTSS